MVLCCEKTNVISIFKLSQKNTAYKYDFVSGHGMHFVPGSSSATAALVSFQIQLHVSEKHPATCTLH